MSLLVVRNLRKHYGSHEAVKDLSFEVKEGQIFALLGANGAGKSTTLRMIATILTPTAGEITVGGLDTRTHGGQVRQQISYLPEEAGAYKNLTGRQYLQFMAGLYAKTDAEAAAAVQRGSDIAELGDRLDDKVSDYSKGMTRKLLLARTIMTLPKLAILDEPTSGLDVINSLEIRHTIRRLTDTGMAVLLSSHNMLEVETLSDRVGMIVDGTLRESGTPAELKRKHHAANLEEVFMQVVA
jgi:ABC-2 type transport system ATP-binding protein